MRWNSFNIHYLTKRGKQQYVAGYSVENVHELCFLIFIEKQVNVRYDGAKIRNTKRERKKSKKTAQEDRMKINVSKFSGMCTCGREHEINVKDIIVESGAVNSLLASMKEGSLSSYRSAAIICDENTKAAAKKHMKEIWSMCEEILLPSENLHANNHGVDLVRQKIQGKDVDLILAVGSGTVHDLSRFVAYEMGIPFVSVPTAASVDGFVSTVAAMTWNGMKKTMPAAAPIYVYADSEIFSRAPYRLTASGISDLLGKYIALTDWKIAHEVTGEYICERVCQLEMQALEEVGKCLEGLRGGETEAYEELMYALLLSGLAMQMIGNSRPASCAEHHVSHLWEMEVINDHVDALHGEKVSIGLILNTELYEKISRSIRRGTCKVKPYEGMEHELIKETFGAKGLY
ncbi:MAG: sn-glycerol-1-phosphate dehydrogenase, partial [Clostridia bacterium]|nr:sn-glycerol-1-phosphate dehydrogenase [Clostridia bacterium]